jgi:tetratricopeptide (TPR) repeat protein
VALERDDAAFFGFGSDDWLEGVRAAETPEVLGSLGPYELVAEAGRGGQGVVYRARQPGTGRLVAVKRLLAGALASPAALRRFEREIEASTALSHPGIVAVYGADVVDGAPLLTMEWVEGVPITTWARRRSRIEVLRCFARVCDAVQHAHQHGVLHRDLKPSNVIVDGTGRPRVLDFGLAKLASDELASVTTSGGFVGTPAYAAPEQWRGLELDARADVYSLGALLFEMLTGRRLIPGEGLNALVRAAGTFTPPRPSSLVRSIPRELDAIVLQALAADLGRRYQSVDALSADVQRFLEGDPVLAHSPSAWYLLRKLVARNRLITALIVGLVLSVLVYAVQSARNAERLGDERDRALQASAAEKNAREDAERERARAQEEKRQSEAAKQRAEDALAEADRERERALGEQRNSEGVLTFLLLDMIEAAQPGVVGHQPTMLEILRAAAPRVSERFGHAPAVEARVHSMLGWSLHELGSFADAEAELRKAIELLAREPATPAPVLTRLKGLLGRNLMSLGKYEEAEPLLCEAIASLGEDMPRGQEEQELALALNSLFAVYYRIGRYEEARRVNARALQIAPDRKSRLVERQNTASLLIVTGKEREGLAELEGILDEARALFGERSPETALVLQNIGTAYDLLSEPDQAESYLRRAREIQESIFGPEHPAVGLTLSQLGGLLASHRKAPEEAEVLCRRATEILRASSGDSVLLGVSLGNLGVALSNREDYARAEEALAEAVTMLERHLPDTNRSRLAFMRILHDVLSVNGKTDEADRLLQRIEQAPTSEERGWLLLRKANASRRRPDPAGAQRLYEEAIAALEKAPSDFVRLADALDEFAALLRERGARERADEIERRSAELRR